MKRLFVWAALATLALSSAVPAIAQEPETRTVTQSDEPKTEQTQTLTEAESAIRTAIDAVIRSTRRPLMDKGFFYDQWMSSSVGFSRDYFETFGLSLAPGYAFNRSLFARVNWETNIGLWQKNGAQIWESNMSLGPQLGVNLLHLRSKRDGSLSLISLVGGASRTLLDSDSDWRYAAYDLGVELSDTRTTVSLGVRHYYSFNRAFDRSRTTFHITLGWKLFK